MRVASSITRMALCVALVLTQAASTDALDEVQEADQSTTIHIRIHKAGIFVPKPIKPVPMAPPVKFTLRPVINKTPSTNQKPSGIAQKPSLSTKKPESPDGEFPEPSDFSDLFNFTFEDDSEIWKFKSMATSLDKKLPAVRECLPLDDESWMENIATACTWGNGEGVYSALYMLNNGVVMSKCVCNSRSSLIPDGFYWGTADMTVPTEDDEPSAIICFSAEEGNTFEDVVYSFDGYMCAQE
ncbi:hypothetical protein FI667_g5954, partial [Globisporangium splendens]